MPLILTHLNADATFLLTFRPSAVSSSSTTTTTPPPPTSPGTTRTFSILLDPWLVDTASVYHPKFARSRHRIAPCISSLREIPAPDLVVISQGKTDHCNEATLRQLPPSGTKTIILAPPPAAKRIHAWRHFPPDRVRIMSPYDARPARREMTVSRFVIPPLTPDGAPGEVTVALLSPPVDLTGLHTAIGITYRPPTATAVLCPATVGEPSSSSSSSPRSPVSPPDSPRSFRAVSLSSYTNPSDRPMSIIFSPHGLPYRDLRPYASTHLVTEAALPLDLLLHAFDRVDSPWWLGGNISLGFPGGLHIARNLLAKRWISAHDEVKEMGGIVTRPVRTRRYHPHEVRQLLVQRAAAPALSQCETPSNPTMDTEVMVLDPGEMLHL